MNHDIITHTPITLDNGKVVEAYIHKLPSGMYAMHADYPFTANSNPTRTRQIVDALFRSQHRDWFRFIRFQRSSTPLPMPTLSPTKRASVHCILLTHRGARLTNAQSFNHLTNPPHEPRHHQLHPDHPRQRHRR